jgi:hypothetical protein
MTSCSGSSGLALAMSRRIADISLTRGGREGPSLPLEKQKSPVSGAFRGGRYWARTSDPQLVELVLSQLS